MHENEGLRTLTRGLRLDLSLKCSGWGDLSEKRVFGGREKDFLSREKWENENQIAP